MLVWIHFELFAKTFDKLLLIAGTVIYFDACKLYSWQIYVCIYVHCMTWLRGECQM